MADEQLSIAFDCLSSWQTFSFLWVKDNKDINFFSFVWLLVVLLHKLTLLEAKNSRCSFIYHE